MEKTYTAYEKSEIERHFVMLLAAPRRSGKSYLVNKLLIEGGIGKQYDHIIIASPTMEFKDEYEIEDKLPKVKIHKFTNNLKDNVQILMMEQKRANKLHFEQPTKYKAVHTLLILDDCIDSKLMQYRSSENIADELAERGRHYNMSLIVSSQSLSSISPSLRKNAELIILFSPTNYADVERVLGEYVPSDARREFRDLSRHIYVTPYSFMIVDNSPARRRYYKLRFRRGFTDLVFPFKKGEDEKPSLGTKAENQCEEPESVKIEEEPSKKRSGQGNNPPRKRKKPNNTDRVVRAFTQV